VSDSAFERFQKLFERAVELPVDKRTAFLAEACAGDAELRARIEELLAADAELEGFLEPPAGFGLPVDKLKQGAEDFLPEEEIGGYQLLRELGRGGRGVVYLARDPKTDAFVALKVLGMGMLPSAVAVERFRREAKAVARLSHPGVVRLVRAGEESSRPYLVMEYIEGHTLADEILLQRYARDGVELPPQLLGSKPQLPTDEAGRYRAAVELVRAMADALGHAHERGVLHRDIKPQNVLLDKQGQPHLVDFGLAFVEGEQELTRTGDVEGTPNYMSPEQVRAERDRIDLRTDVYSLGVVLYELLTLRRPFDAPTANQVMQNITRTMPPRIRRVAPSVPSELELVCTTAIEKRRRDRYASMASLRADLDAYLNSGPLQARRPGVWTRSKRAIERRPMPSVAAGVAVLALALGAWGVRELDEAQRVSALHEAIDTLGLDAADPGAVDLSAVTAAMAKLPEGKAALSASRQRILDRAHERARDAANQQVVMALRDPELPMRGISLAESPWLASTDAMQAWDWVAQGRIWGFDQEELTSFVDRARSPQLLISLVQTRWDEVQRVAFGRQRTDTLGREAWQELAPSFGEGIFELEAGVGGTLRIEFMDGRVREITCLPIPLGSIRRLRVDPSRIDELEWTRVEAAELSIDALLWPPKRLGGSLQIEPFRIQTSPLSYREFIRFVDTVGYSWSMGGASLPPDLIEAVLDKPVGWVTLEEAAACAAWYGVRLPAMPERELAVRGSDFGYLPEGFDVAAHSVLMSASRSSDPDDWTDLPDGANRDFAWMRESLPRVDRVSVSDLSASGIRLGHGGIYELTTTDNGAVGPKPLHGMIILCGTRIGKEVDFSPSDDQMVWTIRLFRSAPDVPEAGHGFRCVAAME
jgi:serine/threonine protein kinase